MDRHEQLRRLMKLVQTVAISAVALPPHARDRYIAIRVATLRRGFEQEFRGNPQALAQVIELVDKVDEWTRAMVEILETSGGKLGNS